MSHQNDEEVKVNFGGTAILSFLIVFVFLLMFSTCHGPFNPGGEKAATVQPSDK